MAIETINGGNQKQEETRGANTARASLSFIENIALDQRPVGVDEHKLAEQMAIIINERKLDASLHIFSRESFPELAYSSIVMTKKVGDETGYFVYLIENTGTHGITSDQYIEMLETDRIPFVTTDAIDDSLFNTIEKELGEEKMINLEGIVIPAEATIENSGVHALVAIGYNALNILLGLRAGLIEDISIKESIEKSNAVFTMRASSLTQPYEDSVGRLHNVSWGVSMYLESRNRKATSPNTLGTSILVTDVKGRLNFLPEEYVESIPGMPPQRKVGFHPQIILDTVQGKTPSLSFALIGLYTSAVMAKDNNWMRPIIDGASPDIGVLNKIIDIFGDKAPKAIDIAKGKLSIEEKVDMLSKMAALSPVISMDITLFDDSAAITSAFIAAANGNIDAAQEIIDTMSDITSGAFPANFDPNSIFAGNPIELPDGTWIDKNGNERSIDEIDTTYIMQLSGNVGEVVSNYTFTELGQSRSSFADRCLMLQRIGIVAKLNARKVRVTFSTAFIDTLINAFTMAGLSPRFDATNLVTKPTGFAFTSGMFQGAGISNIGAFQQMGQGGQGIQDYQRMYGSGYMFR